ncbi:MAG: TIGR03905 family TSCPD domain-containing protein [Oscillospiraceae bacterium]|nr:TIGR03905 family TSCPD domain-containing protein [Oscillospiraceae bacterium]
MHFRPKGVCAQQFEFDVENGVILAMRFRGGCPGNLSGISKLLPGMRIDEVISRLEGVTCGFKPTSCPDQISRALKEYRDK